MPPAQSPADELTRIARRAMLERGLQPDFPPAALAQLSAIQAAAAAAPGEAGELRDLRALPWCSIDNDESRDLDQLSVAEPLAGGAVRVQVAIADVDASVPAGSPIDAHAGVNTTSVYTAAQVFPMLPERLSTDLTSLGEGARRLSLVVGMTVAADGTVSGGTVYRACVVNHAKLAYDGVGAWLAGSGPPPARVAAVAGMERQLRIQDRAAQALKGARHAQGALRLATPEAHAVFYGRTLVDLRPDENNRARELIEYFMIAANGVAACFLEERGSASLRRVLRVPERWGRIVELARRLGEPLPAVPDARALSAFLARREAAAPERFADLSLAVVKLLGAAEYVL
ncbi:MAG TPA: ribonuclease catalytic domain-containing protein, partial [Steroidobacteraceae bacterium]|nr:ribonuclease catalytic domain-containing protein [Steroidobacteraceae bacterium]